ncbi:MAG: hypothetical protein QM784_30455 [Polyangiaceae bacterium]
MTAATSMLRLAAVLLGALTLVLVVAFFFAEEDQPGRRAMLRYNEFLDAKLRFLRIRMSASKVAAAQLAVSVAIFAVALADNHVALLILLPLVALGPKMQLDRLASKRVTAIEAQIEPWLVAVANGLKASPSLGEAISGVGVTPFCADERRDCSRREGIRTWHGARSSARAVREADSLADAHGGGAGPASGPK